MPETRNEELLELVSDEVLEIRDEERREIHGRIIPYGETVIIRGRPERFARGALAGIRPEMVVPLAFHNRSEPVGIATELEERDDGAYATFRISRTARGDEMLELARDGALSFSPGFYAGEQDRDGTHRRLRSMPEVSLVTRGFQAYSGARVLAVREGETMPETQTIETTPVEPSPEPIETRDAESLGRLETRMSELHETLSRISSIVDAPRLEIRTALDGLRPLDWFRAQLDAKAGQFQRRDQLEERFSDFQTRMISGQLETRLLEDITGEFPAAVPDDDISALVVEELIAGQLVNVLDRRRRFFSRLGSFPMPRSGYARIPVVTQHTLVDVRTGQKEPANSRKMIVTTEPFEAVWYDGAVDIALEVIRMSDVAVIEMVWNDLLGQYAIATEGGLVALIEAGIAGAVYTGAALPTNTYAAFAAAVATQALVVEEGSGAPATLLAVTGAQWPALVAMVNAEDAQRHGSSENVNVSLTATSFSLPGGIEVFYGGSGLTQAVLTNSESIRVADGGPERVEARNVELMGHDLGLLGRAMVVPRIPAGIVIFGDDPNS